MSWFHRLMTEDKEKRAFAVASALFSREDVLIRQMLCARYPTQPLKSREWILLISMARARKRQSGQRGPALGRG
jgi:hypothetical protein